MAQARDTLGGALARAIHRVLKKKFREAGKDSVSRVEEQLNYSAGLIRSWRVRGDIRTGDLFDILRCLKVDPILFFKEVLAEEGLYEDEECMPVVLNLRTRKKPPKVLLTPENSGEGRNIDLGAVELQLFSAPKALEEALLSELARRGCGGATVPEMGLLGSAWRVMGRLSDAANAIICALRFASSGRAQARLLQRLSSVAAADYNYVLALYLVKASRKLYLQEGLIDGVGRTFLAEGGLHGSQKRMATAQVSYQAALRLLPRSERTNRLAAWLGVGFASLSLGEIKLASSALVRAKQLNKEGEGRLTARVSWLAAGLALAHGRHEAAVAIFQNAIEKFRASGSPIDASLVSLDLIEALQAKGECTAACQIAREMRDLVFPLAEECAIAERAVMALSRAAEKEVVDLKQQLRQARAALESGRYKAHQRALYF